MFDERLSAYGIRVQEEDVHWNLSVTELVEQALVRKEGQLASNGSLVVTTGERTGRSPHDRFIVDTPDVHSRIAWGATNKPISDEYYRRIKRGVCERLSERDPFVIQGLAGARRPHSRKFMVVAEEAHQALSSCWCVPTVSSSGAMVSQTSWCWPPPASSAHRQPMAPTPRWRWSSTSRSV